jgi:CHC2 zinc finger
MTFHLGYCVICKSDSQKVVVPLHGDQGGPMVCHVCYGKWHAEQGRRRKAGRVVIRAMMPLRALAAEARSVRLESEIGRRGIKLSAAGIAERCGPCPVCGGTDRFSINLKKQVWNCRRCERGGDVIELVRHIDGLSFGEAVRLLACAAPQKPAPGARHGAPGDRNSGAPAQATTQPDNDREAAYRLWLRLWRQAVDPRRTLVKRYLEIRRLELPREAAFEAIRFHPDCPFGPFGHGERFPASRAQYRHQ